MGVTIHYRGTLDDPRGLPDLLIAVRLFCFKRGWKYIDVDDRIIGVVERWATTSVKNEELSNAEMDWTDTTVETQTVPIDDTLRGVIIQPHPDSESVWQTFNQHGEMCFYHGEETSGPYWEQRGGFTKTQFAPIETHIAVCELLHMVKDEYFPGLVVSDEGEYWETGDANRLAEKLGTLNRLMDSLAQKFDEDGVAYERGKPIDVHDPEWKRGRGISAGKN